MFEINDGLFKSEFLPKRHADGHTHNTRNRNFIRLPPFRTTIGENNVYRAALAAFNEVESLLGEIVELNLHSIKNIVKSFYFNRYMNPSESYPNVIKFIETESINRTIWSQNNLLLSRLVDSSKILEFHY